MGINARAIAARLQERGLEASPETREALLHLLGELEEIVAGSTWAFVAQDRALAERVIGVKGEVYGRARDIQRREMQSGVFSLCKSIQTFCPIGPWIVTPDEIPDPHKLDLELRVNGEKRQVSNTDHMSVTIPEILSHYSPMGYSAGDIVSTGTSDADKLFPNWRQQLAA